MAPNPNLTGKQSAPAQTITLRIEDILNDLREESKHHMESINTIVNKVLKSYVDWHKPALQANSDKRKSKNEKST